MVAYYNEFDEKAAAWLRELIARGLIADGVVDTRSIEDVEPRQLAGFTQCHFFAGIGVWSYALRQAGWPDDRPVWTMSCPCQPFSAAGKGGGFDDERHLWPAAQWLIQQRRPQLVFGEQVASKDAEPWLDLVQADLEGMDYAFGACAFPSAGVGAPHIRDRLFWVADTNLGAGAQRRAFGSWGANGSNAQQGPRSGSHGQSGNMGDTNNKRLEGRRGGPDELAVSQGRQDAERLAGLSGVHGGLADADGYGTGYRARESLGAEETSDRQDWGVSRERLRAGIEGAFRGLADADGGNAGAEREQRSGEQRQQQEDGRLRAMAGHDVSHGSGEAGEHGLRDLAASAGPVNGFWRDADWLFCRDGQWRPVEARPFKMVDGSPQGMGCSSDISPEGLAKAEIGFPLGHKSPARVARLRGYGNAINAEAAAVFIRSYMDVRDAF